LEYEPPEAGAALRAVPIARDEALYRLGDSLLHTDPGLAAGAEWHFQEALRLNPRHARAHAGLAQVRAGRDRFEEAFAGFETAMRIDPADDWIPLLFAYALIDHAVPGGISRYEMRDEPLPQLARARELFQRSTRRNPEIGEAWAGIGQTYLSIRGDVTAGIEALEKAHRLLPAREDVVTNLASLHARGGSRDRARDLVDRILLRSADPATRSAGAEILFRGDLKVAADLIAQGKIEEGMKRLRALRDGTQDPALRDEVDRHLREMEATEESNRQIALYNAAIEQANRHDYDGAIARLEKLLARPVDLQVKTDAEKLLGRLRQVRIFNRAVNQVNTGDLSGAAALLREILRNPLDPDIGKRAGDLLAEIERRR
jgi:tetratricopeptide (TPR) repeat protein